ncbi:MAG: MotA/TolQ/ExbB proton channel family protein [Myxococcales bacterium]|jgi:biopolymer transport protein TolQ|nr:MotA/TolQ/ExbB proton channel family protein [Myxococcales bacterium]
MPLPSALAFPAPLASAGLDYFDIILHSGPIGIGVLLLLIGASIASWAIIALKYFHLRDAHKQTVRFLDFFWKSKRLEDVYEEAEKLPVSPISQLFRAGYVELTKVTANSAAPTPVASATMSVEGSAALDAAVAPQFKKAEDDDLENIERALRRASVSELTYLESKVSFLATVGSAAPFVGLFGTVWGIMGAFQDIYLQGNANLATVAKPISEALIATAVGLFAAIPAVVAYNFFLSKIKVLEGEMESFSSDFLNIVKRHFFK